MDNRSVLVIRYGALGDLVCATTVIDAIKCEFGEKTVIDFVCAPGLDALFSQDDRVNKVWVVNHSKLPIWLNPGKRRVIRASKARGYDLMLNFQSGHQFQRLVTAIHAKKKAGYSIHGSEHIPRGVHVVDAMKRRMKGTISDGVLSKKFPRLVGSPVAEVGLKYGLQGHYFVVSPSNSHHKKSRLNHRAWSTSHWATLIEGLSRVVQVVIVGNKGEGAFFDTLRPFPEGVVDLVGRTSLVELVGVVNGACGLVSTDTGTAHIASAVGTEVFTIIGPTPASETGPFQSPFNRVHIISANLACSPCYKTEVMKNCTENRCMTEITAAHVFNTIDASGILVAP